MMSDGLVQYVSCGVLWLGLAVKAPDLIRHWRDPQLRVICAVMALAGWCFAFGSPPTVGAINRLSGIPNLAAPLTYAVITAYSAMSLILVVYWKGGPDVGRIARYLMVGYSGVLVGIALLFALGDAPVERRTDFDTYYATTPFTAEMIVLYLLAHLAAVTTTALCSLRWARQVHGWLRAGLITLGAGTVVGAGYSVSKLTAVVAWWCGVDWSSIGSDISPGLAGLGALLIVVGILIPWAGPTAMAWLLSWRTYQRLAPLERELDAVLSQRNLRLPRPWPSSAAALLIWRQTSINNALGHVDVLLDSDLFTRAHDATLESTGDPDQAQADGWAAAITALMPKVRDGRLPAAPAGARPVAPAPDTAALVRISGALTVAGRALPSRPHHGSPTRDAV
ncbi:MAB_1171c family putative transporter [Streptomyces sp. NPDC059371]|uniref:MAB_1171c family putative transporter n=1 Tax=Streptomyces sp. NPDC059371 TaxID=3346812 RepID=UPI003695677D